MKISIIGTGAYSLGIASILAQRDENKIILWTEDKEKVLEFNEKHQLNSIYPDYTFSQNISITNSYQEALKDYDLIFLVTSVKFIKDVCYNIKPYYNGSPIVIASKGIVENPLSTLSSIVKNILKTKNICVISGPTFAIDLINNNPAALAIAGFNKKSVSLVKDILTTNNLKLRISNDIKGIELCGSIKNIIAIGVGIIKGLGYSESTQAFLVNESIHDMREIIYILGGKKKTILSFAGIGDLFLTCSSMKSRNFSYGFLLGSTKNKEKCEEYLKNNTVEGFYTLDLISKMLKEKNKEIELITLMQDIISFKKEANELIDFLIKKD